jgi:hypothetical protein
MLCKNCRLWQQQIPVSLFLGSTYEKEASPFASSAFDFGATGLRTIQFLFKSRLREQRERESIYKMH